MFIRNETIEKIRHRSDHEPKSTGVEECTPVFEIISFDEVHHQSKHFVVMVEKLEQVSRIALSKDRGDIANDGP